MKPQSNFHFSISERKLYLRFFDIAFVLAGLFVTSYLVDFQYFNFDTSQSITWIVLLTFYLLFFGEIFEMYNLKVASEKYLTLRSVTITSVFTMLFYIFTPLLSPVLPQNRIQIVYFFIALFLPILVSRFIYIQFIFSPRFLKNILVIAEQNQVEKLIEITKNKESNVIVAYISSAKLKDHECTYFSSNTASINLSEIIKNEFINEIVVSSKKFKFVDDINAQLIELFEKGVVIRSVDSFIEDETNRISESQLSPNFYNYFTFSKSHQNNLYLAFRRTLDILFALVGTLIFLMLIPLVLIGNLIGNKGPLLYKQYRVGKRGELFEIIKFRTMVTNAEEHGAVWATKNDIRVTVFGRILRKTRIDEFPQFLNVLKGDMSLIGPRPERPEFIEKLEKEFPFYAIRHVIKPGLTGWAQVMHPYANTIKDQEKKLLFDLYYIKQRNLLMDFKIVIKTISTILFFRGT
jgi:exopolysaccharide biosynthesis polyprenyl glycosylphosphotransferase